MRILKERKEEEDTQMPEERGKAEAVVICGGFILPCMTPAWSWDHFTDDVWVGKKVFQRLLFLQTFKDNAHYQATFKEMKKSPSFCKDVLSTKLCLNAFC